MPGEPTPNDVSIAVAAAGARASRHPRSRAALLGLLLTFSVALALLLAVAGELVARRILPAPPGPDLARFLDDSEQMLAPCGAAAQLGPPSSSVFRVAVVGESNGFYLGRALAELAPSSGGTVRVVNCAQNASTIEHIARRFDEVAAAHPDAIVFVAGHNLEFQYLVSPIRIAIARFGLRSRLVSWLSTIGRRPGEAPSFSSRLERLALLLDHAREIAGRERFRVLVTTLVPNELIPPSMASAETERSLRRAHVMGALRGRAAERIALEALQAAGEPLSRYVLGRHLLEAGIVAEARLALAAALEADPQNRVRPETNELLRRSARSEPLVLLDLLDERQRAAGDGITAWESDYDNCHLHADLYAEAAARVLAILGRPLEPTRSPPPTHLGELLRGTALAALQRSGGRSSWNVDLLVIGIADRMIRVDHSASRADAEALLRDDSPLVTALLAAAPGQLPRLRRLVAEGAWSAGEHPLARQLNRAAASRAAPGEQAARLCQSALFDAEEGHLAQARTALLEARTLNGRLPEVVIGLELLGP